MVPSAFVVLERLPLTPNGKLDRRALPAPGLEAYATRQYAAPQGRIESALAEMWQGLLGIDRIGREDNFFDLGGHSILGIRLIALIAERLGAQPSVGTVFQYPTIQQMARLVERILLSDDFRPEHSDALELEDGVI
jgi:acyl carrier protein